ncbi:vegetative cell wall protein gp1-like [Dromiciops gliroides]|uniref:vegetative cell wall protein gp1-like n=1 Tax=Dromiciops gliroides TaxID=33562 RepID=UPI001CC6BC07|nr:vegetative cell wall protein gp1-like [Dromiciops gliroides]
MSDLSMPTDPQPSSAPRAQPLLPLPPVASRAGLGVWRQTLPGSSRAAQDSRSRGQLTGSGQPTGSQTADHNCAHIHPAAPERPSTPPRTAPTPEPLSTPLFSPSPRSPRRTDGPSCKQADRQSAPPRPTAPASALVPPRRSPRNPRRSPQKPRAAPACHGLAPTCHPRLHQPPEPPAPESAVPAPGTSPAAGPAQGSPRWTIRPRPRVPGCDECGSGGPARLPSGTPCASPSTPTPSATPPWKAPRPQGQGPGPGPQAHPAPPRPAHESRLCAKHLSSAESQPPPEAAHGTVREAGFSPHEPQESPQLWLSNQPCPYSPTKTPEPTTGSPYVRDLLSSCVTLAKSLSSLRFELPHESNGDEH